MTIYDEIRAALAGATPGPWEYGYYDNDTGSDGGGFWQWWSVVRGDDTICEARVSEQDARLIALTPTTAKMALRLEAADRLAEALVAALEAFEEFEDYEAGRRALLPSVKYRKQFASEALAAYRQKEGGE